MMPTMNVGTAVSGMSEDAPVRIADVKRAVCLTFKVTPLDLVSHRRNARLVLPRHVAMYLCKVLTPRSYPDIAYHFGGRDHTTAMYAFNRVKRLIGTRKHVRQIVDECREAVSAVEEIPGTFPWLSSRRSRTWRSTGSRADTRRSRTSFTRSSSG